MSDTTQQQSQLEGWEAGTGTGNEAPGRIKHEAGVAYGPFKFLNPTTRREHIQWNDERRKGVENAVEKEKKEEEKKRGSAKNEDGNGKALVVRKWRARDNRKGSYDVIFHIARSNVHLIHKFLFSRS